MKHLYTNGTDTVIATSTKDAVKVWEHWTGGDTYDESYDPWELVGDDDNFSVMFEGKIEQGDTVIPATAIIHQNIGENGKPLPNGFTFLATAKASEWAKSNKRCFLCSTEF